METIHVGILVQKSEELSVTTRWRSSAHSRKFPQRDRRSLSRWLTVNTKLVELVNHQIIQWSWSTTVHHCQVSPESFWEIWNTIFTRTPIPASITSATWQTRKTKLYRVEKILVVHNHDFLKTRGIGNYRVVCFSLFASAMSAEEGSTKSSWQSRAIKYKTHS